MRDSAPFLTQLTRRTFLAGSASTVIHATLPRESSAKEIGEFKLIPGAASLAIVDPSMGKTDVWCFNGKVPGPELRVRQGDRIRLLVENKLPEQTTVHWHGVRLPNSMDGVPYLTQAPIEPNETFAYEFDCLDAGTFWYHPHFNSSRQVGRGLYGALIVEERQRGGYDREFVWVISDWRLRKDASISDDFGNLHDITHAGRIGNTVTINGRILDSFPVRAGERIRLRLINAANARIFALSFADHTPTIIAIDGQPVQPHEAANGRIVLGPAMRVDLLLDLNGDPGRTYQIIDDFYSSQSYRFLNLVYTNEPKLSGFSREPIVALPSNPLEEPNLNTAKRVPIILGGGMMGRMMSAKVNGKETDVRTMFRSGIAWALNGIAATEHTHEPLFGCRLGQSYILELKNETAFPHPMHLHGHSFRLLSRNGVEEPYRPWMDTVLLKAHEMAELAFIADNPGDWMFHCHVLEHQVAGMMATIRVE